MHNAGLPCLRTPLPWGQRGITRGLDHDCSIACNEGMPVVDVCAASKVEAQPVLATAGVSSQESGVRALTLPKREDTLCRCDDPGL